MDVLAAAGGTWGVIGSTVLVLYAALYVVTVVATRRAHRSLNPQRRTSISTPPGQPRRRRLPAWRA